MSDRKAVNKPQGYPNYRKKKVLSPTNFLSALLGFLFILCFSVTVTLNLRQIYYMDIKANHLSEMTGLSEEQIRENYDTLIDYNMITNHITKLEFPNFYMSEHGEIHFAEVKRIFILIQYMAGMLGVLYFLVMVVKIRKRDYGFLRLTTIVTVLLPVILGALAAKNWQGFFIKFHQIFFRNDYWIFDPWADPVINILPDSFFLHCLIAILVIMVLVCVILEILYRILRNRRR